MWCTRCYPWLFLKLHCLPKGSPIFIGKNCQAPSSCLCSVQIQVLSRCIWLVESGNMPAPKPSTNQEGEFCFHLGTHTVWNFSNIRSHQCDRCRKISPNFFSCRFYSLWPQGLGRLLPIRQLWQCHFSFMVTGPKGTYSQFWPMRHKKDICWGPSEKGFLALREEHTDTMSLACLWMVVCGIWTLELLPPYQDWHPYNDKAERWNSSGSMTCA